MTSEISFLNFSITSADFGLLAAQQRSGVFNGYELQTRETGLVESDTVAKLCNYSLMGSFFKQQKSSRKCLNCQILIHLV